MVYFQGRSQYYSANWSILFAAAATTRCAQLAEFEFGELLCCSNSIIINDTPHCSSRHIAISDLQQADVVVVSEVELEKPLRGAYPLQFVRATACR